MKDSTANLIAITVSFFPLLCAVGMLIAEKVENATILKQGRAMKIEIIKRPKGWYFRIKGKNNKIIVFSEHYKRKSSAYKSLSKMMNSFIFGDYNIKEIQK